MRSIALKFLYLWYKQQIAAEFALDQWEYPAQLIQMLQRVMDKIRQTYQIGKITEAVAQAMRLV